MLNRMMNKYFWWMPALSGILLWLGWPPFISSPVLFIALIPLLYFDHESRNRQLNNWKYFLGIYYGLFVWNTLTTWWVFHATEWAAAMLIVNSLLMSIPFILHNRLWKLSGGKFGYFPLVILYTAFEYFHHNWDISWPWLTLGNGFARSTVLVQWYEFTGSLGGSLWIWTVNLLLFNCLLKNSLKRIYIPLLAFIVPAGISLFISQSLMQQEYAIEGVSQPVLIIQPNIDPYEEKFDNGSRHMTPEEQLDKILRLAEEKIHDKTKLLILPETAITGYISEDGEDWRSHPLLLTLKDFIRKHPNVKILSGADTYQLYRTNKKPTETARKWGESGNLFMDVYNSAILLDTQSIQIYHKSKLVPGVELMPYPSVLGVIDLGGLAGNVGRQAESEVFEAGLIKGALTLKIAPVICYESIYGDYLTSYIRKGAHVIVVMTNDGWWADTDGYKQHLHYARLRAIETRRQVLRSANTGISARIDESGNVHDPQGWWVEAALATSFDALLGITFYVRYGDLIGPAALWGSLVIVLYLIWLRIRLKKTGATLEQIDTQ